MLVSDVDVRSVRNGEAFIVTAIPALVPGMPGEAVRLEWCAGEDTRLRLGDSRGLLP